MDGAVLSAVKCDELLVQYRSSSVSGRRKMRLRLLACADGLSASFAQVSQLIVENIPPSPASMVSSAFVGSFWLGRKWH